MDLLLFHLNLKAIGFGFREQLRLHMKRFQSRRKTLTIQFNSRQWVEPIVQQTEPVKKDLNKIRKILKIGHRVVIQVYNSQFKAIS